VIFTEIYKIYNINLVFYNHSLQISFVQVSMTATFSFFCMHNMHTIIFLCC
jgi:hypothetical protein